MTTRREAIHAIAQLRHAYWNLCVMKQKEFANGRLAPAIATLEKFVEERE